MRAVEAGAAGIDMQGYTFHLPSKDNFCGNDEYSFTKGNPKEIVTDEFIISKQCDFIEKIHSKGATKGKGVNGCVEVVGISQAMNQALECDSWMGRISLLGCTRVSDSAVDYYQQVHRPGVKLIGAHNFVRPKYESYPHHWTHHDDCRAILDMIASKRIQVKPIISRIESPSKAPQIYNELCDDKNFPIGTVFDWRNM